jgi:gliding motility-associated-like protein
MIKVITAFLLLFCSVIYGQDLTMQNGTFNRCSGVFYDSAGAAGDYANNENFEITLCPNTAGQKIQLDFTTFNTETSNDFITIFNGNSNTAPVIGTFFGNSSPGLIRATSLNASGCLTIQFTSNGTIRATGWAATMSCFTPCQTITAQLDSATPAPNADGYIRVCPYENIELNGSGVFSNDGTGATYEWDLGDGRIMPGQSATFFYPNPGVYIANLNIRDTNVSSDPLGCPNTVQINQVIQVANEPDFIGTQAADSTICFGDSTTIDGIVKSETFFANCTPPVSGQTFLPDGSGVSYETPITVDCYNSNQVLNNISELTSICINMEHSFLGDLTIEIISPNGQTVVMHNSVTTQTAASANLGMPWAVGSLDTQSSNTTPGVGGQYCFVPGNAFPTLENGVLANGVFTSGDGPGTYLDYYVPEGNYRSLNPLTGLVGSPLNGIWKIRVTDNFQDDNGYIFSWGINFDPSILPADLTFTPAIVSESWDADPSITNTSGNVITVQPTTAGNHCFTYRVTDDFGCEYTEQVCIDVLPEIITASANDLYACNTGIPPYVFDLTMNNAVVTASAPNPSDLVVTYYETQADADVGTNVIGSANNYSGVDGQIMYARIEYQSSGCYKVETFTLVLTAPPTISSVADMETCDDVSNDGFEVFDLNSQSMNILGSQLPADFNVSYYTSFANADSRTNMLSIPYTNTVNPQPIFVRVERAGEQSCYSVSPSALFNLRVNYRAIANTPPDLIVCDDISNNGVEIFDLTLNEGTILGTQNASLFTVSYYDDPTDADLGSNPILNPTTFSNTGSPQTIYARIEENANPICYGTTSFNLIVNPLPTIVNPTPLEMCDDLSPDGITIFDLTSKDNEITTGDTNLSVSYYETNTDAIAKTNVIANPNTYMNRSVNTAPANPQTLYVVVTDLTTSCVSYTTLTLRVLPNPTPNTDPSDLILCDDINPGDLQEVFDVTINEAYIINGQLGVTASYHISQNDAVGGINALANPTAYTNISTPQTMYVRITDDLSSCYTVVNFNLVVNPLPLVVAVSDMIVCEDNSTGFYAFDLESKNAEVLNGQNPLQYNVTYHITSFDADNQLNALVSPYINITNPQQIFVAITNTVTGCSISTQSFNIEVQEIPEANGDGIPIIYVLCDNIGDNDGFGQFDLTTQDVNILDGQDPLNFSVTFYTTLTNANLGVNPIPTIYENITNPQQIFARVDDDTVPNAICYAVTSLNLRVDTLPVFDLDDTYVLCIEKNGTEVKDTPILNTGLSTTTYSFEWSLNGTIILGETNSSLVPLQGGIYSVIVTNNTTGCENSDAAEVIESAPPNITANVTTDVFSENNIIEATATGVGEYEYNIDNGSWQDSGTFKNVSGGEHIVTARDKIGCGISSVVVIVIDYPLYFTPNGDNFNDTWNVKGLENQLNSSVFIYDRFGKLLKQISAAGDGWNGTFNGALMPSNDYWFTVIYTDVVNGGNKEFSSHFTLKR